MLNFAVQVVNQSTYPNNHKQERQHRKDQPWRRLATKNKIAQVKGWNLPTYREKRTLNELLEKFGEYSYLTGKHLGKKYLSTLDIDLRKEEFPEKLVAYLEKSVKKLVKFLQTSYDKTKKGLHIDILTPKPLDNETIYWTDKLGKRWNIGSIQSAGKYVVGEDKDKGFIQVGKWYWKAPNEEVKTILSKFFFEFKEVVQPLDKPIKIIQKIPQQPIFLNSLTTPQPKYAVIQAKILSKQKIPWLTDIWKVFYLDSQSKQTGYFLANGYTQKISTYLSLGAIKNIRLIQGRKYAFFSRLL